MNTQEKKVADMKEQIEKLHKQDIELMNSIKILVETFDRETYERYCQAEEIQNRMDDLLGAKGDPRAGKWETPKAPPKKQDPSGGITQQMLDDLKQSIMDEVNQQLDEIKGTQKAQITQVPVGGTTSASPVLDGRMQESLDAHEQQLSKLKQDTHERCTAIEERQGKAVTLASFEEIVSKVNSWEGRFSSMQNSISSLEVSIKSEVSTQIQEVMRSHTIRADTLAEQQLSFESRLQQAMLGQGAPSTPQAYIPNDIDARVTTQEATLKQLAQEISAQLQQVMRSNNGVAEQQALLQTNTSNLQMELTNLKKTVSSKGPVSTPPLATNGTTKETVTKTELEEQLSKVKQLISQSGESGGGGAPAVIDAVAKGDFEKEKKDLWEAITQLQHKQVEASKQKAAASYATYQDVSGTAPTLVQAAPAPVYKAVSPAGAATPPGGPPRSGSTVSPARVIVRQASSPMRYPTPPAGAQVVPVQPNAGPGTPRVQIIRQTSQGPVGMPLPTTSSFAVAGAPTQPS